MTKAASREAQGARGQNKTRGGKWTFSFPLLMGEVIGSGQPGFGNEMKTKRGPEALTSDFNICPLFDII